MTTQKAWLAGTVGYEVYVRSFSDSTGDGTGDLRGIADRLDYLRWLGVDIVWVTPFYPSPGHDHGYDVADYTDVNPIHGTLDDAQLLIDRTHELGMKIVFDIVPNHTSSEHVWFQRALADPHSLERNYYLFRDPGPSGGPPNNWRSHFGGPAWTLDEASGQYWCHLFLPEQPDLNWRNPAVLEAFDKIYRFWFERGVDGFRIDVAHGLLKHPDFLDNPQTKLVPADAGPMETFFSFEHRYDMDQDDNVKIFERWQKVAAEYDACLLAESGVEDHERLARYVGEGALDLTFFLKPGWLTWEPEKILREHLGLASVEPFGVSWVTSNHDNARPVSRFGGGAQGARRALAVTALQFALGGVPFLYQGEELSSPNGFIHPDDRTDPISTRNETDEGRDVCRTPMAWDETLNNGFSSAEPWLKSAPRPANLTVAGQRAEADSALYRYKALINARRDHPDLWQADLHLVESGDPAVAVVQRGTTLTVANLSEQTFDIDLGETEWTIAFDSLGAEPIPLRGIAAVPPESTLILVVE